MEYESELKIESDPFQFIKAIITKQIARNLLYLIERQKVQLYTFPYIHNEQDSHVSKSYSLYVKNIVDAISVEQETSLIIVLTKSDIKVCDDKLKVLKVIGLNKLPNPQKLFYIEQTLYITSNISGYQTIKQPLIAQSILEEKILESKGRIINIFEDSNGNHMISSYQHPDYIVSNLQNAKTIFSMAQPNQGIIEDVRLGVVLIRINNQLLLKKLYDDQIVGTYEFEAKIVSIQNIDRHNEYICLENGQVKRLRYRRDDQVRGNQIVRNQNSGFDVEFELITAAEDLGIGKINYFYANGEIIYAQSSKWMLVMNQSFQILQKQLTMNRCNQIYIRNQTMYVVQRLELNDIIYKIDNVIQTQNLAQYPICGIVGCILFRDYVIIASNNQIIVYNQFWQNQAEIPLEDKVSKLEVINNMLIVVYRKTLSVIQINTNFEMFKIYSFDFNCVYLSKIGTQSLLLYDQDGNLYNLQISDQFTITKQNKMLNVSGLNIIDGNLVIGTYNQEILKYQIDKYGTILQFDQVLKTQLNDTPKIIHKFNDRIYIGCQCGSVYMLDKTSLQCLRQFEVVSGVVDCTSIMEYQQRLLINCNSITGYVSFLIDEEHRDLISHSDTENLFIVHNKLFKSKPNCIIELKLQQRRLEYFEVQLDQLQIPHQRIVFCHEDLIITNNWIMVYGKDWSCLSEYNLNTTSQLICCDHLNDRLVCCFLDKIQFFTIKQQKCQQLYQIQLIKPCSTALLVKNYLFVGQQNCVTVYQNQQQILQFDIFRTTMQIKQLKLQSIAEDTITLDILSDQYGLAIFSLKYTNNAQNDDKYQGLKVHKKLYQAFQQREYQLVQRINNKWLIFTADKLQYQVAELSYSCLGSFLNLSQWQEIDDIIMDSCVFKGRVYYLGISGGIWANDL